jgi:hypothetical protein
MANVPRRPRFYFGLLTAGFILGGFLHAFLVRVLPDGAPKQVLTFAVSPKFGPFSLDLLVMSVTIGPIVLTVSVMAVVGVILAYLLARSLF